MQYPTQRSGHILNHLLSLLAVNLVFAAFVVGAPTAVAPPGRDAPKAISARACPSVADLAPQLIAYGLGENTIFYTKPTTSQQANFFALSLSPPGHGYFDVVQRTKLYEWLDECNELGPGQSQIGSQQGGEQDKLVPRISQALAQAATGTAYIMISAGADIRAPGSVWGNVEFPTLQRNPAIARVVRVDPLAFSSQSVVWKAGDPVFLPPSNAA